MKKVLKIIGIILAAMVLIIAILPFAFKGKINGIIKTEVNKNINAKFDFSSLGLNFFSAFPSASLSMSDVCITGIDDFERDTLFFADKISATVNLKSLFGNAGYEITKIVLNEGKIFAHILENGKVNWDIAKLNEDDEAEPDDSLSFKMLLKSLTVNNSDVIFKNDSSKMDFLLKKINLSLSGDMTADLTHLKTSFTAEEMSFVLNEIPFLNKAHLRGETDLEADLANMKFSFANSALQLNEIKATLDGSVSLPEDGNIAMKVQLSAPETQFKDILSLIPAIYSRDFEGLKTSGEVSLNASADGVMTETEVPAFNVELKIADALFQYPAMPKSLNDINAEIRLHNAGGVMDNTLLEISKFRFTMAGNPFDLSLYLKNMISDPDFRMTAVGKLNLSALKEIYPLDSMELSGNFDANLRLASRMSHIQKGQYDKVEASGTLNLKDMTLSQQTGKDIKVNSATLTFSPRYVDLSAFSAQIDRNDIKANGKLENFIPYFLNNETIKGNLAVSSNYLNLNDFMTDSEAATDTTSVGVIEIPKNLDLTLTGDFKQVIFDNLDMQNVVGQIIIKDGRAEMKNLSMLALGGKLKVNGSYDTGKNPEKPDVSLALDVSEASFAKTFSTFVTIQKIAPIFESLTGEYSTHFEMNSPLGADFMPDLALLSAAGQLSSTNLQISDNPLLNGLASTLKNESLKELKIKDLKLPFTINDGKVTTKPFDINFGEGTMNLEGTTSLDQSINYIAKIALSGKLANNYANKVDLKIGGTFTKPTFSVDAKSLADEVLGNLVGKTTGSDAPVSEQVTQKVSEEIAIQSERLRSEAKIAGDSLIALADKEGKKLIEEANKITNPLAKVAAVKAAEASAQKLNDEAKKKAAKLSEEAEKQIEKL